MSTGKKVGPGSRSGTAGRWRPRQMLGQLAALAAVTLGLVLAATAANAQMGRSDSSSRIGAPALRNLSSTSAATDPARPVSRRASGVIATPPAPAAPAPACQIAVPLRQLAPIAPIAPLSSSTSSSTAVPIALPTGGSTGVPVSAPGGGREGLAACLEFWDSATHMTKAEWKAACERSVHRLETIGGTTKP